MTYASQETSIHDGRPVELFRFEHGGRRYLYTSADGPITVPGHGTFRPPEWIDASEIYESDELSAGALVVSLARWDPVAAILNGLPPVEPVLLSVFRVHRDSLADVRQIWSGAVHHPEFEDSVARLHCETVLAELEVEIPAVVYHPTCNRQLFSPPCGVAEPAFTVTGFITQISGEDVWADEFSAHPDGWFKGGRARPPDRPIRFILEHEGARIRLASPIPGLLVGDQLPITAGCDGLPETCATKYQNLPNYLGFDIPTRDPWAGRIS